MFSPAKAIAGVMVFAMGGAFLIAQSFDQQGGVAGAATDGAAPKAAVVSGRFESVSYDTGSGSGYGWSPDGLLFYYRGQTFDGQAEMSDVRLNGELTASIDADIWEPHEGCHVDQDVPSTCVRLDWGTLSIENDEGTWVGRWVRQFAEPQVWFIELVGTEGYEGWSAILSTTDDLPNFGETTMWSVSGAVFNGNLPPDRDMYVEA